MIQNQIRDQNSIKFRNEIGHDLLKLWWF